MMAFECFLSNFQRVEKGRELQAAVGGWQQYIVNEAKLLGGVQQENGPFVQSDRLTGRPLRPHARGMIDDTLVGWAYLFAVPAGLAYLFAVGACLFLDGHWR